MIHVKREQRIVRAGIICTILLVIIGLATAIGVLPDKPISNYEIRAFGLIFLFLILFTVVILVMIRNSINANTTFLLRLRDAQMSQIKSTDNLEKATSDLYKTNQTSNKVITNLTKEISRINDAQIPE